MLFSQKKTHQSEPGDGEGEVLGDDDVVLKHDGHVQLEVHAEVGRLQRGTGEEAREEHVEGNSPQVRHVTAPHLDVLNLADWKRMIEVQQSFKTFNIYH